MVTTLTLPKWYDLHVHLRQGVPLKAYIKAQLDMGCTGVLAMPNTQPPVAKILKKDDGPYWSIESYLEEIKRAGGDKFTEVIVPLYLTRSTTPEMIIEGARLGILKACKYYPPHGTTNADHGAPFDFFIQNGVFEAMAETSTVLCVHGEKHGLKGSAYFDAKDNAETLFYKEEMPRLVDTLPRLRVVAEHITTKVAADFVKNAPATVAATITPQHLLYTVGDLIQGLKYHLYCLPVLKYEEDFQALRQAATQDQSRKFFAGTDSAPHALKATECGCAAGCFTGGIAPQLYARAFEEAGVRLDTAQGENAFRAFLCENGPRFYRLPIPVETFVLEKEPQEVKPLETGEGARITPLPLGLNEPLMKWSIGGKGSGLSF
ncbi:MAG: dihydroorotase [Pseudobdellovibrionaceae bacterium]